MTKKPSRKNDHLNRDSYIYLSILSSLFSSDVERVCGEFGLTEGHYRVLWVLCLSDQSQPLAMGDIIDGVVNKASDVTRLVDKLEKLELVIRQSSPKDRRRVIVTATAKGRRVFARLTENIKALHYEQWAGLSAEELAALIALLQKALHGAKPAATP